MENINIYKYPETNCWECTKDINDITINKKDLLLKQLNCIKSFNCNNYVIEKGTNSSLQNNYNTEILNKQHNSLKYLTNYYKLQNEYDGKNYDTYTNEDSRLKDGMRPYYSLELDRPPIDSSIKLKDIYNKELENYGQNYKNVSDINAGDILYYDNNLIKKKAFYTPIFDTNTYNNYSLYKDPMDNISIQNKRIPLRNHNYMSVKDFKNEETKLSFIADTEEHRQDLLSLQYNNTIDKNSRTRSNK